MTDLSIIIPVYNREKTIEKCLMSVIEAIEAEPGFEAEIILVDDGSADGSLEICRDYVQRFDFITLLENEHKGVSGARNAGIMAAKGEYVCFIDSDDFVGNRYIAQIRAALEGKPELALFNAHYILAPKGDFTVAATDMPDGRGQDISVIYPYLILQKLNPCWDKLYRTDIIREHSVCFDDNMQISEDFKFTLDFAGHCKTANIFPQLDYYFCFEVLGARKINSGNISDLIEAYQACNDFIKKAKPDVSVEILTGRFLQLLCEFLIRLYAQGELQNEIINSVRSSLLYKRICEINFKKPKSKIEKIIICRNAYKTGVFYLKAVRAAEKALNRIN